MEVVSARAALLSNFEVLSLLRELENDHIEQTRAARAKKEEDPKAQSAGGATGIEVSENLRTIEVEAIQYLSASYLPTASQTSASITNLTKSLGPYSLTKAEKLQVINLAPTQAVELYVIVEELEDRLGDQMEDILDHVRGSLNQNALSQANDGGSVGVNAEMPSTGETIIVANDAANWNNYDSYEGGIVDEDDFVDHGEGAGVEGDLDMEED